MTNDSTAIDIFNGVQANNACFTKGGVSEAHIMVIQKYNKQNTIKQ